MRKIIDYLALRKAIFVLALFLVIITAIITLFAMGETQGTEFKEITYLTEEGEQEMKLEVARTPKEREKGLQNRQTLNEDGMIFVYENEDYRSFWMKNTYIPLDIIFLDQNKNVINIEKAEPGYNMLEDELPSYASDEPSQYVVEIKQGKSQERNISTDTQFNFSTS